MVNNLNKVGYHYSIGCFLSGFSILFESASRRSEIGYFVLAKGFGSVYRILKRKRIISVSNEYELLHILFFGILYYVYCDMPSCLKYRKIFSLIWGTDWYLFTSNLSKKYIKNLARQKHGLIIIIYSYTVYILQLF